LHPGSETQAPDPAIVASEGPDAAPAYRGTAYIVFEDLELSPFGNRIPQITVEVFRKPQSRLPGTDALFLDGPAERIRAVSIIPGTGEYAYATEPVRYVHGPGRYSAANVNTDLGLADFEVSLRALDAELPRTEAAAIVASWFGDDLRAGQCTLRPKVEQHETDGDPMPWRVSGVDRAGAALVSRTGDAVNFGGTPADASLVQAIRALAARGKAVTFYPFILMDVPAGNGLPDPHGGTEQAAFPWRGRIASDNDGTAAAGGDVAAFMGSAAPSDFVISGEDVIYAGPAGDWGLRRMVLHYAHLCAVAGGVEAFCLGSELRGLTTLRDASGGYPFVQALIALASDVRAVLGPDVKISYAADWSEYFGHQPSDGSGDVFYHLDPFWASPDVDFVGIDAYFPLADWRDGDVHADAHWRSILAPGYLEGNIEGGEGYDWFYASPADRDAQARAPISDGAHGDDHVFRPKDLRNWWGRPHFDRPGGVRSALQTAWEPELKPIRFTEIGCPAVNKGANEPNVFHDALSSESGLPHYSTGARDDAMQYRYLDAVFGYWAEPGRNPVSLVYGGPMLEMDRAFVWAWDARPWPDFPGNGTLWADAANHARGHWISGRLAGARVDHLVAEIAGRSGLDRIDVSALEGVVPGVSIAGRMSARAALQPILLARQADASERGGTVVFRTRSARIDADLDPLDAVMQRGEPQLERVRDGESLPRRLGIDFIRADEDYQRGAVEASLPGSEAHDGDRLTLPLALSEADAGAIAERALAEAAMGIDRIAFAVDRRWIALEPGDVVGLMGRRWRIDRITDDDARRIEAVAVDPAAYASVWRAEANGLQAPVRMIGPVEFHLLDLPLLRGDEIEHAPWLAATSDPWPGPVAVLASVLETGFELDTVLQRPATFGTTATALPAARAGLWQRSPGLEVTLIRGVLEARSAPDVLAGANTAALRRPGGADWEVIQFMDAELVAPGRYRLDGLLRGQAGTEWVHPETIPDGSDFVLLDSALRQAGLPPTARGLERNYRVGPAARGIDDPAYRGFALTFEGVGIRPYAPVHLRAMRRGDALDLTWIRRTRTDGDAWRAGEVPLGEEEELYRVDVRQGGIVVARIDVDQPGATLSLPGLPPPPFEISVSQVSSRWGAGPETRMTYHG
ncbi:MAG: baseplate multidomain protein megatron, partial [Rubricella sp.]